MTETLKKVKELQLHILRDSEFAAWLKQNWAALYEDIQVTSLFYPYFYNIIENEYIKYVESLEPTTKHLIKIYMKHVDDSIASLIERLQCEDDGYDCEKDDITITYNGKSLTVDSNADTSELLEAFIRDLYEIYE